VEMCIRDRGNRDSRLTLRLAPEDLTLLRERAGARSMASATYAAVLLRSHLRNVAPLPKEELLTLKPVSYTHLDVYKRQDESTVTDPGKAVFLSYASQDTEAAQNLCNALRAAGVEVWFDQSELRGGDAWDRQIRKQIHDCALFVPVISVHSDARHEGYFRREWKLAVDLSLIHI